MEPSTLYHVFQKDMKNLNRFSFGATSSITTSLSLIVGVAATTQQKVTIISALAILAIADNISDSLGIHIYRESENAGQSKLYTLTNFLTRLILTSIFAAIVILLPSPYMEPVAIAFGITVLSVLTYLIAIDQKLNPYLELPKHLAIAALAMVASHFVGEIIRFYLT
jgi:vacuolar iron transporter family protein